LTDRLFEGDRVGDTEGEFHLVDGDTSFLGDLLGTGLPSELGLQARLGGSYGCQRVVEVHGDPDGAGLVGDGPGDGLTDPPGGVRRELEARPPVELPNGSEETQDSFLEQVEEVDTGRVGVTPSIGDDEPQVGGEEGVLGLTALALGATQLDLFLLALVVALLEALGSVFPRLDLLGELDLLLCRQQVVFADGSQVLRNEVGGEPTALVGELALKTRSLGGTIGLRIGSRHETHSSLGNGRWAGVATMPDNPPLVNPPIVLRETIRTLPGNLTAVFSTTMHDRIFPLPRRFLRPTAPGLCRRPMSPFHGWED